MSAAILTIAVVSLVAGIALSLVAQALPADTGSLVGKINELLPQTQCGQCGFPGCRPYAIAVAEQQAAINLCPPGGEPTVARLAKLLGRNPLPLAEPGPALQLIALIDETRCIGCTYCRAACPVDAIVGAQQLMHTVIESECTGCGLCVAPCPVDCIDLRARR